MKKDEKPMENNRNERQHGGMDTVVEFCRKNVRYISAGILFLLLILLFVNVSGRQNHSKNSKEVNSVMSTISTQEEKEVKSGGYEVNAYPEVNSLIEKYYQTCAKGDMDAIDKYASPVSDTEKSYLKVCSKYVEAYKNITCYTKPGLKGKNAYLVSVYYEMKLKGVKTLAPGLDFFYVEEYKTGKYRINNVCSLYNLENQDYELDKGMDKLIKDFEDDKDVIELKESVQKKYNKAVDIDKELKKMVTETMRDALADWANQVIDEKGSKPEKEETSSAKNEEKKKPSKEKKEPSKKEEPSKEKKEPSKKGEPSKEEKKSEKKETKEKSKKESEPKKEKTETLYTTSKVNIRINPDQNSEKLAEIEKGTEVSSVGTTDSGWTKVTYDGKTAYIKSEFLSKDKPAAEEVQPTERVLNKGETIRLTQSIIIRSGKGEDKPKVGTAFMGESLTVVENSQEGWTKVSWKGVEGYAKTDVIK